MIFKALVPKLPGFQVKQILCTQAKVTLMAYSITNNASCSQCGQLATRVHSRHTRSLRDLPSSGKAVELVLHMRRFFCDNRACPRRTFAEQVPTVAGSHAQRTVRLAELLRLLAMALGGEAGSRVVDRLSMRVSPDTLLRLIRQIPPADSQVRLATPRVLGVDDWALRKGRSYGTILVDLEQHRPVELLPERSAETLAAWLQAHPGVEIIRRDRCGMYAEGATRGAPTALQVADRWHLLQNLREALERVLESHPASLQAVALAVRPRSKGEEHRRHLHRSQRQGRYHQVLSLHNQGHSERRIARQLNLNRLTVSRYLRAGSFPERARRKTPCSMLKAYESYLEQRWTAGQRNAMQLWREVKDRGYPGSSKLVRVWAYQKRNLPSAPSSTEHAPPTLATPPVLTHVLHPPSARQMVWLFVRPPKELSPQEKAHLSLMCQTSADVAAAYRLGQSFLNMVRERQAEALLPWLAAVQKDGPTALQGFVRGLRRDYAAVKAAFTEEWSNGQTEGQVNRLKLIKRQMYGRANFDLLRLRVLG
jgi:transposase